MPKGGDQMMAAALVESASGSGEVVLHVEGMMCTRSCTPAVAAALRAVPGVEEVSVSLEDESARVRGNASVDAMISAVNATGKIASIRPAEQPSAPEQQCGSNTL